MNDSALDLVISYASSLPVASVAALCQAVDGGQEGIHDLLARSASPAMRDACKSLGAMVAVGVEPAFIRGALAATTQLSRNDGLAVEPVWTGPATSYDGRLTLAVVRDLIAVATQELLLASYAVFPSPHVVTALHNAAHRGVKVTLLLERPEDNPKYTGPSNPFPGLLARRLAWLRDARPQGAAMHAKLLVVDRHTALIGSANLTGGALDSNLESGVLIRDVTVATELLRHIEDLVEAGDLSAVHVPPG